MAKLVNKLQAVTTGVQYPKSVYSRVVSCRAECAGGGGLAYSYTRAVGQSLWLLSVDFWGFLNLPVVGPIWSFRLWTGIGQPGSVAEIGRWERVIPIIDVGVLSMWPSLEGASHFHWDLSRLFTGEARRFGFDVAVMSATNGVFAASFRVSEG